MRSVLITGAAGLVGAAVGQALSARGVRVTGTDLHDPRSAAVEYRGGDLADKDFVLSLFRAHPFDAIVHCGGISGSMLARDDPEAIFRANIVGTFHLLEAARTHGPRRFVFCSSASVYGSSPAEPVVEETALHPISVYGASKVAGEAMIEAYVRMWGFDAVALRIFQVYGPGRTTDCQVRELLLGALQRQPVELGFHPETRRQYVHVDDVVDALLRALSGHARSRLTYNISGAESLRLDELSALVASVVGPVKVRYSPTGGSPRNDRGTIDISAARQDLGYEPRVGLREGVIAYAEWLGRQLEKNRITPPSTPATRSTE